MNEICLDPYRFTPYFPPLHYGEGAEMRLSIPIPTLGKEVFATVFDSMFK